MSFFKLDTEKCKRDGICEKVCVAMIIRNDENRLPYIAEKTEQNCLGCGLCVAFCPHDACSVEKLDETQFKKIDREELPDGDSANLMLMARRSVRQFKQKSIDDALLAKIMNTVRYAPTAKNSQNIRWVITKTREETLKVAEITANFYDNISKTLTDARESVKAKALARAFRQGKDVILRGAPQLAVAVMPKDYQWRAEDGAIALTYFEVSANANGVGTCWAGYFTTASKHSQELNDYLGIKEGEAIVGAQMFGYPVYKTRSIPSRKASDITFIG